MTVNTQTTGHTHFLNWDRQLNHQTQNPVIWPDINSCHIRLCFCYSEVRINIPDWLVSKTEKNTANVYMYIMKQWKIQAHSNTAQTSYSVYRGRGATGPGVNWPHFSGVGSTYGAWPLTFCRVNLCPIRSCCYSFILSFIHVFIYSVNLLLFNWPQIMIVPKDLKLKSINSIHRPPSPVRAPGL